jgi:hypothetical protein
MIKLYDQTKRTILIEEKVISPCPRGEVRHTVGAHARFLGQRPTFRPPKTRMNWSLRDYNRRYRKN